MPDNFVKNMILVFKTIAFLGFLGFAGSIIAIFYFYYKKILGQDQDKIKKFRWVLVVVVGLTSLVFIFIFKLLFVDSSV